MAEEAHAQSFHTEQVNVDTRYFKFSQWITSHNFLWTYLSFYDRAVNIFFLFLGVPSTLVIAMPYKRWLCGEEVPRSTRHRWARRRVDAEEEDLERPANDQIEDPARPPCTATGSSNESGDDDEFPLTELHDERPADDQIENGDSAPSCTAMGSSESGDDDEFPWTELRDEPSSNVDIEGLESVCCPTPGEEKCFPNAVGEGSAALSEVLCKCTQVTQGEALAMCLALGIRHSLTWTAIADILQLINKLWGKNVLPSSKYLLMKHMEVGKENCKYHIHCPLCERYLGVRTGFNDEIECKCGKVVSMKSLSSYFISVQLGSQIKGLLSDENLVRMLDYRHNRKKVRPDALEDIYDGLVYKRLNQPGGILWERHNLSYCFNTDGIPIGKSSKQSMWPIYVMINELPPNLRARHMLLVGLWVGNKEPNMRVFLQPFVEEANTLSTEGISWIYRGIKVNSKIIPICAVVDSVARCSILNMTQFNGYHGCTICYQRGVLVNDQVRFPLSLTEKDRTHEEIVSAMRDIVPLKDANPKATIMGVKGPSPLMNLLHFNLAEGPVGEYMHLLGAVKKYTALLLTSAQEDYYIGSPNKLSVVDDRLLSIKPPSSITRTPRSIKDWRLWKASEWRSWLIFYCLPCLDSLLPDKYLHHFAMLSSAFHILLQRSVSDRELEDAQGMLKNFVFLYEQYFGEIHMVYNVHLLTHVTKGVRNWGPLWTHNAFPYENQNRILLQMRKNPTFVAQEVVRKFLNYKALPSLCKAVNAGEETIAYCQTVTGKFPMVSHSDRPKVMGKGLQYTLNGEELASLKNIGLDGISKVERYSRMLFNGVRYTCLSYAADFKSDDSVIGFHQGKRGKIISICSVPFGSQCHIILIVKEIILDPKPVFPHRVGKINHIRRCAQDGNLIAITPYDINGQQVGINMSYGSYVCEVPYGCYGD